MMIFAFCIVCLKITANALAKAPSLSLILMVPLRKETFRVNGI